MSDALELHWTGGGDARVVKTDGNFATLHSTRQAATGTPLSATVRMKSGTSVRFKVKDCRKLEEGLFLLVGRWVDLSKAMREEIRRAVTLDGSADSLLDGDGECDPITRS